MSAADDQMKLMFEYIMMMNIQNNSIQFDPSEFSRQASPTIPTNIDPSTIQQVLKALEQQLTTGGYSMIAGSSGASCQFIAAQFKNRAMKHSSLTPTEIEQALTSIIDNIQEYPTVDKKTFKLSYHNNGMLPNSVGTRVFILEGK
ncbi:unnamed protein product [Didymodactylos carnosus]|uniref:Uncharacterized protein n=1 Tax=Didymodactylos carnosus TaxID=1234261 RepID=A0A8S2EE61_9BILA|nr:unnamed protein product [Didymodactylos carnosus]CAF3993009.1 unnamed protein product [Didymodactylos carnosus]